MKFKYISLLKHPVDLRATEYTQEELLTPVKRSILYSCQKGQHFPFQEVSLYSCYKRHPNSCQKGQHFSLQEASLYFCYKRHPNSSHKRHLSTFPYQIHPVTPATRVNPSSCYRLTSVERNTCFKRHSMEFITNPSYKVQHGKTYFLLCMY